MGKIIREEKGEETEEKREERKRKRQMDNDSRKKKKGNIEIENTQNGKTIPEKLKVEAYFGKVIWDDSTKLWKCNAEHCTHAINEETGERTNFRGLNIHIGTKPGIHEPRH